MKKNTIILILLLTSALLLTSCALNTPSETEKDNDENLSDSESPKDGDKDTSDPIFEITLENANKVKSGMKYSEIVEILGSHGKEVGSGAIIYEWQIHDAEDKQYLHVWFLGSSFADGGIPSNLVADKVMIEKIHTD